jgi:hypothetical protein
MCSHQHVALVLLPRWACRTAGLTARAEFWHAAAKPIIRRAKSASAAAYTAAATKPLDDVTSAFKFDMADAWLLLLQQLLMLRPHAALYAAAAETPMEAVIEAKLRWSVHPASRTEIDESRVFGDCGWPGLHLVCTARSWVQLPGTAATPHCRAAFKGTPAARAAV